MKGLLTILKKEFHRFFRDKKLWITMLLPGILVYAIYSVLGSFLRDMQQPSEVEYRVLTVCPSERMRTLTVRSLAHTGYSIEFVDAEDRTNEEAFAAVKEGEYDAYLIFPADFDEAVKTAETPLDVRLYYNSGNTDSAACYTMLTEILTQYRDEISCSFRVNPFSYPDLAEEDDLASMVYSMIVPYLLLIFVISSAMSITPESIAGEKERGTIATILVTPVRRSYLAIGKIAALSAFAAIGATSSVLGTLLSLPALTGVESAGIFSLYSAFDLFGMFAMTLSYVPFVVGLMAVCSALAKSVKEAASTTGVVMILSMLVGFVSMFRPTLRLWMAFVPILNVAMGLSAVLANTATVPYVLITVGMNVLFIALLVFVLAKLFDSEKVML